VFIEDEALDFNGFKSIACDRDQRRIEVREHLD
jgi:hypothetical protein